MTDTDITEFSAIFDDLRRVFPIRGNPDEVSQVMRVYFQALQPWSIDHIVASVTRWTTRGERFPKPADLIASMPPVLPGAPPLVGKGADEHRRAVAQNYKADPCHCYRCQQAGVSHRLLRYVPDADDGDPRGHVVLDGRLVTRGHWAHGEELRDWYAARDRFFALAKTIKARTFPTSGSSVKRGEKVQKKSIYEVHQEAGD